MVIVQSFEQYLAPNRQKSETAHHYDDTTALGLDICRF